jgi:endonuclease NucS-like protein
MPEQHESYTLPLKGLYSFLQSNGCSNEAEELKRSTATLGCYSKTLKKAMGVNLLKSKCLLDRFVQEQWLPGSAPGGQREISRLSRIYERYLKSIGSSEAGAANEDEEEEPAQSTAFAYEEHLRDYLAQHLDLLEKGLNLWPVAADEEAVEFPVDGRRIDILAKDSKGNPVVIELKVSRGHERTIGQALYYRAKIRELFKVEKVRIFLVALEMSPELRLAAKEVTDVFLFEYNLSMTVKPL